ncbi:MAG: RNA polymerase subunit sigma-70, partial [Actinobacteria bacterium]|nr:RNA polymerase subunit sigma-70 [Actinomycetota bacterium]
MTPRNVHEAVEEVASTSYGRLVAYLASRTGDLAGAEDALADAFEAALRSWPTAGVPDRPVTWMLTAAKRSMIGRRRRSDTAARAAPTLAILADERSETVASAVPDKRLELLFACAHPAIDPTIHAPLMLQTVFGIDVARMSAAFLVEAPALGQRLVRAKRKIAAAGIPFELPGPEDLASRTAVVLDAVYGAYGTGWDDPAGLDPGRSGLTTEAIRLADLLVELRPSDAEPLGLASLLHHLEARAGARRDDQGRFVALTAQDPWRWSPVHLAAGEQLLNRALALAPPGPYALLASVGSMHNRRVIDGRIDWSAVASIYDRLLVLRPTAGVAVARAAAHLEAGNVGVAAEALAAIDLVLVDRYQPYWTVVADVAHR